MIFRLSVQNFVVDVFLKIFAASYIIMLYSSRLCNF